MNSEDLQAVLDRAEATPEILGSLVLGLPALREEWADGIAKLLVALVPKMAEVLNLPIDDQQWPVHAAICQVLAQLGQQAQPAVPVLFKHADRYPRFELDVWAIGNIGGPGVARRLIQWTYWQGSQFDRKRTDAVCGAIRALGSSAVQELLEIAHSNRNDAHERTRALLNLLDNTDYFQEPMIPLLRAELDRNQNCQCSEILVERLIALSDQFPASVIAAIKPSLRERVGDPRNYIRILSQLGEGAIPLLIRAVEDGVAVAMAISALVDICDLGLAHVYQFATAANNFEASVNAIEAIPACGRRSLSVLQQVIRKAQEGREGLRWAAVHRLGSFTDQLADIRQFLSSLDNDHDDMVRQLATDSWQRLDEQQEHVQSCS